MYFIFIFYEIGQRLLQERVKLTQCDRLFAHTAMPRILEQYETNSRMLDSDRGIKGFDINDWPRQFRLGFIAKIAGRPLKELISPLLDLAGTSNCWDNSTNGCSLRMAANATLTLKAGPSFRRRRLVMYLLFPASMPKSGRNPTYPRCSDFSGPVFPPS